MASTETLQYYGAKLLETSQERVSLESRHVLQDFTYSPDYLQSFVMRGGGGAALEHHDFAHLDCPLTAMEDSGFFLIAKFLNEDKTKIAMTGFQVNQFTLHFILILIFLFYFQVPKFHTLYTPPHVLHTNNYLRGTWRTMLSDQFVNEGKLERNGESFHFTFRAE